MQTKHYTKLFLLIVFTVTLASCKKDKEQSRTDILTSGQWKITAFTLAPPRDWDLDGDLDSDIYPLLDACDKDNYMIFKSDGKLELNEGATKCDPLDPQVEIQNWSFANEEKEIIIAGDRGTILEFNNDRFRVQLPLLGSVAEVTFRR
jgi:hypothetical protein